MLRCQKLVNERLCVPHYGVVLHYHLQEEEVGWTECHAYGGHDS